ncbi:Holliday junction branch migration DNA helicase RuvB [Thalassospira xiamenensis]|uniref:Holliday junction branch migration complex subunit RuvB n=1 Tax=Thalassospira xiamenensis TaxID=220697 RepID=A0A285TST2_9PROT|nr:Holliday junction branch migration DNA helicase RuvB [Thalassospira xiamenensis]SOC27041.1 Holliday junction DNA helicase subunit RuvB [Thalassospira xiamenensis]
MTDILQGHNIQDDPALRPVLLSEFVGQPKASRLLGVYLESAKSRNEPLDHTLFFGPPGLGKTTLAQIVANELGKSFKSIAAPAIKHAGELATTLLSLSEGDVLFLDEIHRLPVHIEEVLYSAMEDFAIDILSGDGPEAKHIRLPIERFTLVGATTRSGMLSRPLKDRFSIDIKLELYSNDDLASVILRSGRLMGLQMTQEASEMIACRSRGTPRIANRLLRRVRDFATAGSTTTIGPDIASHALEALGIDDRGLGERERAYIDCLAGRYRNKPTGLKTLSAALGEDSGTIEDEIEPWLLHAGIIERTSRGRILAHCETSQQTDGSMSLFDQERTLTTAKKAVTKS